MASPEFLPTFALPSNLDRAVARVLSEWDETAKVRRLWARDASLWTGKDESAWLGWLDAPSAAARRLDELGAFASEVREAGFSDVLLMGMGGSSLCPEVMAETFGRVPGFPALHVLDSTDPAQVL